MRSERILSVGVSAALLIALAVLCAHWFWKFAAPPTRMPLEPMQSDAARPIEAIRGARLFGDAQVQAAAAPAVRTDLVLRGISASRSGGIAVIAVDRGRVVTAKAGEDIAPGIRLERVHRDHVIVTQNGMSQRIELPQRKPTDAAPVAATAGSQGTKK